MGKNLLVGVGGKARHVKALYVGVGGKARKVKKVYVGVGGKARLVYQSYIPVTGISLSYEIIKTGLASWQKPYKAKITVNFTPSNATNKNVTWTAPTGRTPGFAIESFTGTSCVIYTNGDLTMTNGRYGRITAIADDGASAYLTVHTAAYSYNDDGDRVRAGMISSIY